MLFRIIAAASLMACTAVAGDVKPPVTVEQSDETLRIIATLYHDRESVTKLLGRDPGFPMIVIEVKFSPRGENQIPLWLDDFTLLSFKDGQRSQPLTPSQLAGRGAISVVSGRYQAPGMANNGNRRIVLTDPTGRQPPPRPTNETQTSEGSTGESQIKVDDGEKEKEDPLLSLLKERVLPERETNEDSTGLLYFLLDGKYKPKDLELIYKSRGKKLLLEFVK
jgi:hypothetical protein